MALGVPCHFRPSNLNCSACGIVNPMIAAYDGRDVNCIRCKKTKLYSVYMQREQKSFPAKNRQKGQNRGTS